MQCTISNQFQICKINRSFLTINPYLRYQVSVLKITNFTPIFEAKKSRKVEEKCPGHFDSSQFSPKSAIFGGFEKKSFQK